jgi:hypothetical protein
VLFKRKSNQITIIYILEHECACCRRPIWTIEQYKSTCVMLGKYYRDSKMPTRCHGIVKFICIVIIYKIMHVKNSSNLKKTVPTLPQNNQNVASNIWATRRTTLSSDSLAASEDNCCPHCVVILGCDPCHTVIVSFAIDPALPPALAKDVQRHRYALACTVAFD